MEVDRGVQTYFQFLSQSEADTDKLARSVAAKAMPGMVITLDGDLGAGKTRFSQGFAAALGVAEVVNSPTFTIIKEYQGHNLPLYHMDVYRLTTSEADELGLDEYFYGDGVTLLEWSERIAPLLPNERLEIGISLEENDTRCFTLYPHGASYAAICSSLYQIGVIK